MRSFGVRRRALLVGEPEQVGAPARRRLGSSRGGIDYEFAGDVPLGPGLDEALLGDGSTS